MVGYTQTENTDNFTAYNWYTWDGQQQHFKSIQI